MAVFIAAILEKYRRCFNAGTPEKNWLPFSPSIYSNCLENSQWKSATASRKGELLPKPPGSENAKQTRRKELELSEFFKTWAKMSNFSL